MSRRRRRSRSACRCPERRSSTPPTTSNSPPPSSKVIDSTWSRKWSPCRRHAGRHQPEHALPVHACGAAMKTYRRLAWEDVTVPTELTEVVDTVDYQRVVMNPGATWDYFPGHFDPDYAQRHGHPTIFVNTMHIAGFVDRIATDWAGPYSRVVRRKVSLLGSFYAGDSMVGRGRVVDKRRDSSGENPSHLVDLEIAVFNQRDELCCPAELTIGLSL